jgi:CheY-like chemotaxis protein
LLLVRSSFNRFSIVTVTDPGVSRGRRLGESHLINATRATTAMPYPPPSRAGKYRILIIEDDMDSREGFRHVLEVAGHEVFETGSGVRGVELALSFQLDIALIDVGLPDLDGYEVAQRIRATAEGKRMMLIALTGRGLPEDRERSRSAGFDVHVVKPVDPACLSEIFRRRG